MAQDKEKIVADVEKETREWLAEQYKELRELRKQLDGTGIYVQLPSDELVGRSVEYYNRYYDDVKGVFDGSKLSDETVQGVIGDYVAILSGFPTTSLSLQEQNAVLQAVKPWRTYFVEQFVLPLLFSLYAYNVKFAKQYIEGFKLANGKVEKVTKRTEDGNVVEERETIDVGVPEQRKRFLSRYIDVIASGSAPLVASAFYYLTQNKVTADGKLLDIVEASDFDGVEPELFNKFLTYVERGSWLDSYTNYYYIAKYALGATAAELRAIEYPQTFGTHDEVQEYAERISTDRFRRSQERRTAAFKLIDAENDEQVKQAQAEIKNGDAEEPRNTVQIPETFALLGSRDVYASVNGDNLTGGVLPIKAFIADYMKRNNLSETVEYVVKGEKKVRQTVTPRTVEKVIEGVNLLQLIHHVTPANGVFRLETNISEFARLTGYNKPSELERKEIMLALQILDGLYLAVWRADGLKAVRVFTIQSIGLTGEQTGRLVFFVNADVMKGRPNLISSKDFEAIRKEAKGQAENHFRYQILSKGQKEERALLNEVFGYDTLISELQQANASADEIETAKRNISGHRSRDAKRLIKWFDTYLKRGWLLDYSRTKNGKGEYIYRWRRGNIPAQDEEPAPTPTQLPAPDEQ